MVQMLSCSFCDGKSQSNFLLLRCQHLCCMECAFLKVDLDHQSVNCCQIQTKVDARTIEIIIKSRRFTRDKKVSRHPRDSNTSKNGGRGSVGKIYDGKCFVEFDQKTLFDCKQNLKKQLPKEFKKLNENINVQKVFSKQLEKFNQKTILEKVTFQMKNLSNKDQQIKIEENFIVLPNPQKYTPKTIEKAEKHLPNFQLDFSFTQQKLYKNVAEAKNTNELSIKPQIQSKTQQTYNRIIQKLEINSNRMRQRMERHTNML